MLESVERGTVIRIQCDYDRFGILGFDHYGVCAGKNKVIHFTDGLVDQIQLSNKLT